VFSDSSAFVTALDDQMAVQTFDYFLPAPAGSYTDDWDATTGTYRFVVNTSASPPTFSADLDSNGNWADTTPRTFTLAPF
jgi:hypothetical protein